MYVCVRVRVYSIFDIFPQPFGFLFQHFKERCHFPFPFVDNAKVRHKKSPDN